MDLGNPVEVLVHYLLIEGMTCLSCHDRFPIVSALVYVMHTKQDLRWIRCKAINCHDSPSYYTTWTLNLEKILSLCQNQQKTMTYGWNPKMVIYPYVLGHCWWRSVAIGILNIGTMISYGIEVVCPLRWSKGEVIMKSMAIVIPLMEFDIWFLELECVIWSHNKWDL